MNRSQLRGLPALALILAAGVWVAAPASGYRNHESDVDTNSYRVECNVFVNEQGIPQTVDVLSVKPRAANEKQIGESARDAVLTWTFRPVVREGKPVADDVRITVIMD